MQQIHDAINWLNGYLWGPPMLILLMGTHIFLTIRTGFIQRFIGLAIRLSFKKDDKGIGDVSQFGALTTALAATIGTGNIVGVATAVALGGPGAVLWMWLTGVFGIASKYGEALLAVKYRVKTSDSTMLGGPMYALERGLKQKWLAVVFCVFASIAAFGIGNMVQANSVATLTRDYLHLPVWITGLVLAILTAAVILGGVRSIARVCERLVPFMAIFYVSGCIIILVLNASYVVPAFVAIIKHAFTPQAAGGGFAGAVVMMTMRYGVARGLFSNESGLGSAPIIAAAAQTRNPVRQALVSSSGTFWDTVVVCALTGLVLVSTMIRHQNLANLKGMQLTKAAFELIPVVGPIVLVIGLITFVFSTILGWSYYGERSMEYLLGKKSILPYRILWVIAVFVGAVVSVPFVWDFADATNALMAIPNVIALLLLSGVIVAETRKYLGPANIDLIADDFLDQVDTRTKISRSQCAAQKQ
jgi:AGCS family alanine or glycine:cation symporter